MTDGKLLRYVKVEGGIGVALIEDDAGQFIRIRGNDKTRVEFMRLPLAMAVADLIDLMKKGQPND